MESDEKAGEILNLLQHQYPDAKILNQKSMSRRLHCFYVSTSPYDQQILKVTYECMMDHPLGEILRAVSECCLPAMAENENMEVVLFNDLHIEVNKPQ